MSQHPRTAKRFAEAAAQVEPRFVRPKLSVKRHVRTCHLGSQDQDFKGLAGAAAQVTLSFAFVGLGDIGPTKDR